MRHRSTTYGKAQAGVNGWFAIERAIFGHELVGAGDAGSTRYSRMEAWLWLIAHAAFKEHTVTHSGRQVNLLPGELIVSRRELAEIWRWSPSAVRWFLERLGNSQACNLATAHNTTILSLTNYEKYQVRAPRSRPPNDTVPAPNPPTLLKENNKQLTNTSPDGEVSAGNTFLEAYNALAAKTGLPKAHRLDADRRKALMARLDEHGPDAWETLLDNIERSALLRGQKTDWRPPGLDWFLKRANFRKIIEGAYTHTSPAAKQAVSVRPRDTSEPIGDYVRRMTAAGLYKPGER